MSKQDLLRFLQTMRSSSWLTPSVVILVGSLATALATYQVSRSSAAKDQERFEHAVAQAQDSIDGRIETYVGMLRAGAGFFAAAQARVDRPEFHRFATRLQLSERYPGIQGIGFSARLSGQTTNVAPDDLTRYGLSALNIYPPGQREQIHAIVHLEPLDRRNQAALGFDMYSQPVRRAAMQRARDTGQPAASGAVQLVQEIDEAKQAGFLIYVPVYRTEEVPATLAERRRDFVGFVYSPFRADDLMRGIFGRSLRPRLNLEIYDGEPSPASLLHRSNDGPAQAPRYSATRTLEVAGRPWTVHYSTRPEFEFSSGRNLVVYMLAGGVLATLLLALLSAAQARAKRRADASARKLAVLHATATRLSAQLDPDRLMQDITDAGRDLSGAEIGAFFYNVTDEKDERYMLYALSGAPREAFAHLGMPRNTQVFGPTFRGEGPVRSADITADPRFGKNAPFKGFPARHWPVRSYLAVSVISRSGEILGGLFFGHSQIGVFTPQAEESVKALAGHAAIAIDNAKLFKASQDEIAARKKIEEHQKLLLDELNHRVKNTLASVQSIAAQTLRSTPDPQAFKRAFEARLIALSEAHNLLSRANWLGVQLHDLAMRELAPHGVDDPQRVVISGDPVWLPPAMGVAIGMALHELASNAAKYGSLSAPGGRVEISWYTRLDSGGERLTLHWRESGGPAVAEPLRRGFGSRLIERSLAHELGGAAQLYFHSSGVECVIESALPPAAAAA